MNDQDLDFETLYRRYAADVFRFALYLSGRRDQAEDITAETFVRAWTSSEPIRSSTVKAYLITIARNLYRMDQRRHQRQEPMTDDIADSTPGPETSTAVRRNLERLRAALQQLPEADRSVLIMRAYDELSYEDIAVAMGMSSGAARVKAHRARARHAELLSKEAS